MLKLNDFKEVKIVAYVVIIENKITKAKIILKIKFKLPEIIANGKSKFASFGLNKKIKIPKISSKDKISAVKKLVCFCSLGLKFFPSFAITKQAKKVFWPTYVSVLKGKFIALAFEMLKAKFPPLIDKTEVITIQTIISGTTKFDNISNFLRDVLYKIKDTPNTSI
ncbi:MAG: hypothetical protein E7378_03485 [Clostridiales bacterium]|nr:hypothetical protein [Clostridiales bacterium]